MCCQDEPGHGPSSLCLWLLFLERDLSFTLPAQVLSAHPHTVPTKSCARQRPASRMLYIPLPISSISARRPLARPSHHLAPVSRAAFPGALRASSAINPGSAGSATLQLHAPALLSLRRKPEIGFLSTCKPSLDV